MNPDFGLDERHILLRRKVRDFAKREIAPIAKEMDVKQEFPAPLFRRLAEEGYAGCGIPSKYGGTFADYLSIVIIGEEMARVSASVPVALFPHALLCARNIALSGSASQKERFLPDLAAGRKWGALALAEASAGSDILALRTRASRTSQGYRLKGAKTFITNGPFADVYLLYARTSPGRGTEGLSAFIVERTSPGFVTGKVFDKMGMRGSPTGRLFLKDCLVPHANLLGETEGRGYEQLMKGMDMERVSWASHALGIADASFESALDYARKRKQFGKPLVTFQMIQRMISEMAVSLETARLLTYKAARMLDQGEEARFEASAAKLYSTETAVKIAGDAVQIYGGAGYMKGCPVERYFRDAKVLTVAAGSSEIQRLIIVHELKKH